MSLSIEEGALRIYRLLYGDSPVERRRQAKPSARVHKLIGVASIEEIRERVRLRKE